MVRRNYGNMSFNTYEKPFSYSSLEAVVGDLVIVANTESGNVFAYDRSGDVVIEFSFGRGVPVSREIDMRWREEKIARSQEGSRSGLPADAPAGVAGLLSGLRGMGSDTEEFYRDAEGNTVTPALSHMLVDGDGRVWVQRYPLPGAETAAWQRWRPGEDGLDALIRLPADHTLLDALGNRVLLRTTDEFDVPQAIVATLRPVR